VGTLSTTNSKPFWVVICSVCKKRVNVTTGGTDYEGHAVHDDCGIPEPTHALRNRRQELNQSSRGGAAGGVGEGEGGKEEGGAGFESLLREAAGFPGSRIQKSFPRNYT
jgi:hypothetical protein